MAKAQQQLDTLVSRGTDVTTEALVVGGRVADEIAAVAASERTGLLITALRDRRGWFGARRGSFVPRSHARDCSGAGLSPALASSVTLPRHQDDQPLRDQLE